MIAVTGHNEDSFIERAYEAGLNEVFAKPIDANLLEDVL